MDKKDIYAIRNKKTGKYCYIDRILKEAPHWMEAEHYYLTKNNAKNWIDGVKNFYVEDEKLYDLELVKIISKVVKA